MRTKPHIGSPCCRAAFAGDTQELVSILQQWPQERWKEKDPQGNTVSMQSTYLSMSCTSDVSACLVLLRGFYKETLEDDMQHGSIAIDRPTRRG